MRRLVPVLALAFALTGCDANDPAAPVAPAVTFEITGGLEADLTDQITESTAESAVRETPDGQRTFLLQLSLVCDGHQEERAHLSLTFPLDGHASLPPGTYRFDLDEGMHADFAYRLVRDPELEANYRFEGRSAILQIDRSDEAVIAGELRLVTEQTQGIRVLYGQTEKVELAGVVNVIASFEATVRE